MTTPMRIDNVLNSPSKLAVLRVFASRQGFKATGRAVAGLAGFSAPSTHEALKELHSLDVLTMEVIGKQHIYALNENNRMVEKIIRPLFRIERGFKEEVREFLLHEIQKTKVRRKIVSLILYGSAHTETAGRGSDVDLAVIAARTADVRRVEHVFLSEIAPRFKTYFGVQLDPYVKSAAEFRMRLRHRRPPVSTLIKSYATLFGKEPLEV